MKMLEKINRNELIINGKMYLWLANIAVASEKDLGFNFFPYPKFLKL